MPPVNVLEQTIFDLSPDLYLPLNGDGANPADNAAAADYMNNVTALYKGTGGTRDLLSAITGFAGVGALRHFKRTSTWSWLDVDWATGSNATFIDVGSGAASGIKWSLAFFLRINDDGGFNSSYPLVCRPDDDTSYGAVDQYGVHLAGGISAPFMGSFYGAIWGNGNTDLASSNQNFQFGPEDADPLFFVVTYDGSLGSNNLKVYKDGSVAYQGSYTTAWNSGYVGSLMVNNLHKAVNASGAEFYMAHLAFWKDKALSGAEITAIWAERDNNNPPVSGGGVSGDGAVSGGHGRWY